MPRVKINLSQGELELEGDEAFIAGFRETLSTMLASLDERAPVVAATPSPPPARPVDLSSLGEFLHALPATATDVDKMLAAGLVVQMANADRCFTTGEANRALSDQGVKVGNASQSVKQSLTAKRIFQVQKGRFRVAQSGVAYLQQLTGGRLPEGTLS
ncbi:MAG: hypothetical protein ACFB6S_02025 [Geminicoccaceae bacterium]